MEPQGSLALDGWNEIHFSINSLGYLRSLKVLYHLLIFKLLSPSLTCNPLSTESSYRAFRCQYKLRGTWLVPDIKVQLCHQLCSFLAILWRRSHNMHEIRAC